MKNKKRGRGGRRTREGENKEEEEVSITTNLIEDLPVTSEQVRQSSDEGIDPSHTTKILNLHGFVHHRLWHLGTRQILQCRW